MKKAIAIILCALSVVSLLCACAAKENTPDKSNVSLFDLKETMLAAAAFGDMAYVSSNDADAETYLSAVSDFPFDKVDAFSVCYAKDGKGNADEVVVIRVKDEADVSLALQTLQTHLKTRQSLYATYDPTQSQKVGKGITFQSGAYAVLIVSEDNDAVKQAFVDFMSK